MNCKQIIRKIQGIPDWMLGIYTSEKRNYLKIKLNNEIKYAPFPLNYNFERIFNLAYEGVYRPNSFISVNLSEINTEWENKLELIENLNEE